MGILDKARSLFGKHEEKVDDAVDTAAGAADDKIDTAQETAHDAVDDLGNDDEE